MLGMRVGACSGCAAFYTHYVVPCVQRHLMSCFQNATGARARASVMTEEQYQAVPMHSVTHFQDDACRCNCWHATLNASTCDGL